MRAECELDEAWCRPRHGGTEQALLHALRHTWHLTAALPLCAGAGERPLWAVHEAEARAGQGAGPLRGRTWVACTARSSKALVCGGGGMSSGCCRDAGSDRARASVVPGMAAGVACQGLRPFRQGVGRGAASSSLAYWWQGKMWCWLWRCCGRRCGAAPASAWLLLVSVPGLLL